jgi:hypothetical protein
MADCPDIVWSVQQPSGVIYCGRRSLSDWARDAYRQAVDAGLPIVSAAVAGSTDLLTAYLAPSAQRSQRPENAKADQSGQ